MSALGSVTHSEILSSIQPATLACFNCKKQETLDLKLKRCASCLIQTYCSAECQKADWKRVHRVECPKNAVAKVEQLGAKHIFEKSTPIPGLRLIENVVDQEFHDSFVRCIDEEGMPEQNLGHKDGYRFKNPKAFEDMILPFIEKLRENLSPFKILSEKSLRLALSIVGYEKNGSIPRHVDRPDLSGKYVIVISFLSPVVVNFYSEMKKSPQQHKLLIPPMSAYLISEEARYEWSHEILKSEDTFEGKSCGR
ncbi:MAG: zinc finger MYND domain-containing protein [Actinomycetes bacterium]